MSKRSRQLLTIAAAVAVLTFIYTGLLMISDTDEEEPSADVEIVSIDSSTLQTIDVQLRDSEAFSVAIARDDSGTAYTMSGDPSFHYSSALMEQLATAVSHVSARPIQENCSDLGKYGLSDTQKRDILTITDTNGKQTVLTLGLSADPLGTYVLSGSDVYILSPSAAGALTQPQTYYRDLSLFGGYYSLAEELETLTIDAMADGTTVTLAMRDRSQLADNEADAYSQYVFTQPKQCDADNGSIRTGVLSALQNASTAQAVAEDHPSDVSKYGLDTPTRIHITTKQLDTTLLVGDTTDDGGIYVMPSDGTVYICDAADFAFLQEDWNSWRSTNLFPCALSELDSVVIEQKSRTDTIDVEYVPAEENEQADLPSYDAELNEKAMTDEELQQFFLALTSVHYTQLVENPRDISADVTVTAHMTDGTTRTMQFAKGGSREYLVSVNGGGYRYTVSQDDLTSLLEAVSK